VPSVSRWQRRRDCNNFVVRRKPPVPPFSRSTKL
jgi:hypothetical protein